LVFFILFSLALVLPMLFGEVGSLALYLSEFWPLLLTVFALVALGIRWPRS
jgi:hypothetical protein